MTRFGFNSLRLIATTAGLLATGLSPAGATTFSTAELSYDNALITQFNLVTLGNLTQSSVSGGATTIGGRALVGGNATFSTVTTTTSSGTTVTGPSVCRDASCTGNTTNRIDGTGQSYGALTVFGNLVAPTTSNNTVYNVSVGLGDVDVGGKISGNVALNRPNSSTGALNVAGTVSSSSTIINAAAIKTSQASFAGTSSQYNYSTGAYVGAGTKAVVSQTVASVFPFGNAYATDAKNLSAGLANLPGSPRVTTQTLTVGSGIFFTANADYVNGGKSYGVITTTVADLANETNFAGINNGSNDATFVIVTGDGANYTLPNLNSYAGSNKVIFDFVDATTLKFAGAWSGSILAPLANITSMGGAIDGSVIVNSINQTQALYATNLFTGDLSGLVPEPASLAVIGAGLAALGLVRRRRK